MSPNLSNASLISLSRVSPERHPKKILEFGGLREYARRPLDLLSSLLYDRNLFYALFPLKSDFEYSTLI